MAKVKQKENPALKQRDEEIKDHLEKGKILCRSTLQVMGTPKEHVEKALGMTIDAIKTHENIKLLEKKVFEAEKTQDELWSSFAEIEILCRNMTDLTQFCFDFMPASIEVVEPDHLIFRHNEITALLNDVTSKMHQIEMGARRFNVERQVAIAKMNSVIRYAIMRSLERKSQTKEELMKEVGIDSEGMKEFLESLEKRGEVKKEGKMYKTTRKILTQK